MGRGELIQIKGKKGNRHAPPLPQHPVYPPPHTHAVRTCSSPPGPRALSKSVRPTLGSTADSGSSSSCTAARL